MIKCAAQSRFNDHYLFLTVAGAKGPLKKGYLTKKNVSSLVKMGIS